MRFSVDELTTRRPVWRALSELFLDTNLDRADLDRIARVLADSPYTLGELQRVLLWEVYPTCRGNLFSIAGEWAGFDQEWLEGRIQRGTSKLMLAWTGTVGRLGVLSSVEWRRIKQGISATRCLR